MREQAAITTPIIRPSLFSAFPELIFGLSNRLGGVSPEPYGMNLSFSVGDEERNVTQNRKRFFGTLGVELDSMAIPRQCHSAVVREATKPGTYEKCDGLISETAGVCPVVTVADCVPLFLFDPGKRVVSAVHAGWRGTALQIAETALQKLISTFGSNPADVLAYVGPSAGPCCYEVGPDVAGKFDSQFLLAKGGRVHLDLKALNKSQLMRSGITEQHVEVSAECTICNPEFHSFRRDGAHSGRMMGVIGLRMDEA